MTPPSRLWEGGPYIGQAFNGQIVDPFRALALAVIAQAVADLRGPMREQVFDWDIDNLESWCDVAELEPELLYRRICENRKDGDTLSTLG